MDFNLFTHIHLVTTEELHVGKGQLQPQQQSYVHRHIEYYTYGNIRFLFLRTKPTYLSAQLHILSAEHPPLNSSTT